jgi:HD-like signal output (HDOD) protein
LSAQDLASLIAHDPVLCARVIRESNSAYHGRLEVKELLGAVVVLGFNRATEIALAASCIEAFGPSGDLRTRFAWRRGLLVATAACKLARSVFGGGGDVLFVAGLLHDLGRSALRSYAPEVERAAYQDALDDMEAYARCKDACDLDPSDFGRALASTWNLPAEARFVMLHHHDRAALRDPEATPDEKFALGIVMIAKQLADSAMAFCDREVALEQAQKVLRAFPHLAGKRIMQTVEALNDELCSTMDGEKKREPVSEAQPTSPASQRPLAAASSRG